MKPAGAAQSNGHAGRTDYERPAPPDAPAGDGGIPEHRGREIQPPEDTFGKEVADRLQMSWFSRAHGFHQTLWDIVDAAAEEVTLQHTDVEQGIEQGTGGNRGCLLLRQYKLARVDASGLQRGSANGRRSVSDRNESCRNTNRNTNNINNSTTPVTLPGPEAAEGVYRWLKAIWTNFSVVNALLVSSSIQPFTAAEGAHPVVTVMWASTLAINVAALFSSIYLLGFLVGIPPRNWVAIQTFLKTFGGFVVCPGMLTALGSLVLMASVIVQSVFYFIRLKAYICMGVTVAIVGFVLAISVAAGFYISEGRARGQKHTLA